MSQSSKVPASFGSLKLRNGVLRTGSTSAVQVVQVPAPATVTDASQTLTLDQLKSGLLVSTPTGTSKTFTTPTAAALATFLKNVGDSLRFNVINLGADTIHIIMAPNVSGVTSVGYMTVRDSSQTTDPDSGSASFMIRMTNVTSGSESAVLYRMN